MTDPTHSEVSEHDVEMPAPTAWPLVFAAGVTLVLAGVVTSWALTIVGAVLAVLGSIGWLRQLGPEGEMAERRSERRPLPPRPAAFPVQPIRPGLPGHRMRLPEKMHPYSAGVKGGIIGGLVMPIPAL